MDKKPSCQHGFADHPCRRRNTWADSKPHPLAVSLETPKHQDLIDINTVDISNLKTIDDVLDYVNEVGKERFDNGSIEILLKRIDDYLIDTNKMDISNINSMDDILDYVSFVGMDRLTNERIDILKQRVIDKIYPKKYIKRRKFLFFYKTVRLYCPYDDDLPKGHSFSPKIEKKI